MRRAKILAIDDDPLFRTLFVRTLTREGYEVVAARDGVEGLHLAADVMPELIITDVEMPRMDGWTLVQRLRSAPEFALVPVIFLTQRSSAVDRMRGFALGADDYLPKGNFAVEILLRVRRALANRPHAQDVFHQRTPRREHSVGLSGSLEQVGLASLLSLIEMERRTGVLRLVSRHDAEPATLLLRDGRVIDAEIGGRLESRGTDAVLGLLEWGAGDFEYEAVRIDDRDRIAQPTAALLLEAARRLDEQRRAAASR